MRTFPVTVSSYGVSRFHLLLAKFCNFLIALAAEFHLHR